MQKGKREFLSVLRCGEIACPKVFAMKTSAFRIVSRLSAKKPANRAGLQKITEFAGNNPATYRDETDRIAGVLHGSGSPKHVATEWTFAIALFPFVTLLLTHGAFGDFPGELALVFARHVAGNNEHLALGKVRHT
jgi:hypothetical protein